MKLTRKARKALHVRQVDRVRKLIEDAAFRFIVQQLRHAASELERIGVANASLIFKPREWDDRLRLAVGTPIARAMMLGAATEMGLRLPAIKTSSTASNILSEWGIELEDFATEMPDELIAAIEQALADSFTRPYWDHINGTTANQIQTILRNGTTQGLSIRDMAVEIENSTMFARMRATAIARTESTRALNSGHVLGIGATEAETGIQLGKQWLSIAGATSRPEHVALDGEVVPTGQPFNLGGYPCQFPGDASLPPEHSINCLCTVLAGDLDLDDDENSEPGSVSNPE